MMKPAVFVGSTIHGLNLAEAIQEALDADAQVTVWSQFKSPSQSPIDSRLVLFKETDYAVFVFCAADLVSKIEDDNLRERSRLMFEIGLALSLLGSRRVFVVIPEGFHGYVIPGYLPATSAVTYRQNSRDIVSAIGPACTQLKRSFSNTGGGLANCSHLRRFVDSDEPRILTNNSLAHIRNEKAYQLLVYMFEYESFEEFRAFDLAFPRWEELLRKGRSQALNVSHEIFSAMGRMFQQGRCAKFRRILVLEPEKFSSISNNTLRVLSCFLENEKRWRSQYPGIEVETRIYEYPDDRSIDRRRQIDALHDFAVFSGDDLAIVETILPSTSASAPRQDCKLTVEKLEIANRCRSFDLFWDESLEIAPILTQTSKRAAVNRPAPKAFELFNSRYADGGRAATVVIEASYFDFRYPDASDRVQHLEDALWLESALLAEYPDMQDRIYLEAFVNDFSSMASCHVNSCAPGASLDRGELFSWLDEGVLGRADINRPEGRSSPDSIEVFRMKKTRTKIGKFLGRALRSDHPHVLERSNGDLVTEVYFRMATGEEVSLGYKTAGTSTITPRCTALMAQHYFDIYAWLKRRGYFLRGDLWIFDFNRLQEREAVSKGAEASLRLLPWPKDSRLTVVNCIYNPDGRTGSIRVGSNSGFGL